MENKASDLLVILIRELVSVLSLQQVRDRPPEVHVVKGALQELYIIVKYSFVACTIAQLIDSKMY
jgi:hypothetical protein